MRPFCSNPNSPQNRSASRSRREGRGIATFATGVTAMLAAAAPASAISFNFDKLAIPANAVASRASCATRSEAAPFREYFGGDIQTAQGVWRPAVWTSTGHGIAGPLMLPGAQFGGEVAGIAAVADGTSNTLMIAGLLRDMNSDPHPVVWSSADGGGFSTVALPTAGHAHGGGVSVATGDVNGDGAAEIIVSGWAGDDALGVRQPVLWVGDGNEFEYVPLPSLDGNGGEAQQLVWDLADVIVSGYVYDATGNRTACMWRYAADASSVALLVNLPDGFESEARTETVDNNETITVGVNVRGPAGITRPGLTQPDSGDGLRMLPLPAGSDGGRVNGIIAILIGLLVGGETHGPNGTEACIWINQPEIPTAAINLNQLNGRQGIVLSNVTALLPYVEQDNLYRVVGNARTRSGASRACVGLLSLAADAPEAIGDASDVLR